MSPKSSERRAQILSTTTVLLALISSWSACLRDPDVTNMRCTKDCPPGFACSTDGHCLSTKDAGNHADVVGLAQVDVGAQGTLDAAAIDVIKLEVIAFDAAQLEAGLSDAIDLPPLDVPLRNDVYGGGGFPGTGGGAGGASGGGGISAGGSTGTGGTPGMGGSTTGRDAGTGGMLGSGGGTGPTDSSIVAGTGGSGTGGNGAGGSGTGGSGTGGSGTGGSGTGGNGAGGSGTGGSGTGGSGTGGATTPIGPCDIYAAGSTPCVAAYSMIRVLSSGYTGPLYQVRKGGGAKNTGTGGTTTDIGALPGGFANSAAQDTFCGADTCTVSKLYDQSGKGNHLTAAPAGCYSGTASEPDYESNAKGRSLTVSGHNVYALYTIAHDGYRNNSTTDMPTASAAQGIYEVADGKRYGTACCSDFGNASTDNCYGANGSTNTLFFGTGYWGKGAGTGPWFMGDFGGGVWAGGSGASTTINSNLPSTKVDYAFGTLKTSTSSTAQYAIRVGDVQSGTLTTAYDGAAPATWNLAGGIILGIGTDNSNGSFGTFFEGAITAGRPTDATDAAVFANVQAAGYGQ